MGMPRMPGDEDEYVRGGSSTGGPRMPGDEDDNREPTFTTDGGDESIHARHEPPGEYVPVPMDSHGIVSKRAYWIGEKCFATAEEAEHYSRTARLQGFFQAKHLTNVSDSSCRVIVEEILNDLDNFKACIR